MGIARSARRVRHAGICDASVARLIAQRRLANRARSPRPRGDGYVAVNAPTTTPTSSKARRSSGTCAGATAAPQPKRDFALKRVIWT
jgi:hypothetical protein